VCGILGIKISGFWLVSSDHKSVASLPCPKTFAPASPVCRTGLFLFASGGQLEAASVALPVKVGAGLAGLSYASSLHSRIDLFLQDQ
jgi:hypothetical protein